MSESGPDGINILVLEDRETPRKVIARHLSEHLHELVRRGSDAASPDDVGSLAHLLPPKWGPYRLNHFDVVAPSDIELNALFRLHGKSLAQALKRICERDFCDHGRPDVLVVDLAWSKDQEAVLEGQDLVDRPVPDKSGEYEDLPDIDIRETLDKLTGFRVLRTRLEPPYLMIATTYAKNPLVVQHCLNHGAYAVVLKPVPGDQMPDPDELPAKELERLALDGRKTKAVLIHQYLQALAAEVLKATVALAVIRLQEALPDDMSTDVIRHPDFHGHGHERPTRRKRLFARLVAVLTRAAD
jgi:CheY-like chemotaxis protein